MCLEQGGRLVCRTRKDRALPSGGHRPAFSLSYSVLLKSVTHMAVQCAPPSRTGALTQGLHRVSHSSLEQGEARGTSEANPPARTGPHPRLRARGPRGSCERNNSHSPFNMRVSGRLLICLAVATLARAFREGAYRDLACQHAMLLLRDCQEGLLPASETEAQCCTPFRALNKLQCLW